MSEPARFGRRMLDADGLLTSMAPPAPRRPRFVLGFCALPGAGKSHLACLVAEQTGAVHLSSDALRRQLGLAPGAPEVFPLIDDLATLLLRRDHPVVLDLSAARAVERQGLRLLGRAALAPVTIAFLDTPDRVRAQRLAGRVSRPLAAHEVVVSPQMEALMAERIERPTDQEDVVRLGGVDAQADLARILERLPR